MNKTDPPVASPPLPPLPDGDGPGRAETSRPGNATMPDPHACLGALTDKQRAVLDLLIEHKTSKEISRILGISHHTVDQRIMLARAKLGVASRGEVAQAYRRLVADAVANTCIYEQSVYDFSDVATPLDARQKPDRDDGTEWGRHQLARTDTLTGVAFRDGDALAAPYHHVLPEMFDGPYGTFLRLGTIAVFAMFLILIVMGGLAMFAQLSQMIPN